VLPDDLLISIYRNIEEPDSFYGVHRSTSLLSVLERLDYEKDGQNSLLFHGARLDSEMRRGAEDNTLDKAGIIHSLSRLNLNSMIHTLLQNDRMAVAGRTVDTALQTARNLEQWELRAPDLSVSEPSILFKALQAINNAPDQDTIRKSVDMAILNVLTPLLKPDHYSRSTQASYRTLGILAEIDDVTSATSLAEIEDAWQNMQARREWMSNAQ
jgi:ataxia telangiectasia mutated family protein